LQAFFHASFDTKTFRFKGMDCYEMPRKCNALYALFSAKSRKTPAFYLQSDTMRLNPSLFLPIITFSLPKAPAKHRFSAMQATKTKCKKNARFPSENLQNACFCKFSSICKKNGPKICSFLYSNHVKY